MEKMKFLGFRAVTFTDDVGTTEDTVMLPASGLVAMVAGATDKLELHFKDTNPQIAISTSVARTVSRGSTGSVDNLAVGDLDANATRDGIAQSDMLVITLSVIDEYQLDVMQTIATKINEMFNDDHTAYVMLWDIPAYGGSGYCPHHVRVTALDSVVMEDTIAQTVTATAS